MTTTTIVFAALAALAACASFDASEDDPTGTSPEAGADASEDAGLAPPSDAGSDALVLFDDFEDAGGPFDELRNGGTLTRTEFVGAPGRYMAARGTAKLQAAFAAAGGRSFTARLRIRCRVRAIGDGGLAADGGAYTTVVAFEMTARPDGVSRTEKLEVFCQLAAGPEPAYANFDFVRTTGGTAFEPKQLQTARPVTEWNLITLAYDAKTGTASLVGSGLKQTLMTSTPVEDILFWAGSRDSFMSVDLDDLELTVE